MMLLCTGCERKSLIVHELSEQEANEILVFLKLEGIDAEKVKDSTAGGPGAKTGGDWVVSVNTQDSAKAMATLNRNGLPRKKGQTLLNLFSNEGLVPSELGQQIRKQQGLNSELENTIRKFDGVLDVSVHVAVPEAEGLTAGVDKDKKKITASVYVKHNGVLDDPNTHLQTKIKRLVAGAVSNLDFDNITIIPDRTQLTTIDFKQLSAFNEGQELVSVWGIKVAKNSVPTFRIVFLSLCLVILFLAFVIAWFTWKFHLLIKEFGGVKKLFNREVFKLPKNDSASHEQGEGEEVVSDDENTPNEPKK
ncbi:MAG: sctJ [Chlamydiales bacterium]|jgi:type III secretion protein J|nr:sctJ [Chlamydiales bacterium]